MFNRQKIEIKKELIPYLSFNWLHCGSCPKCGRPFFARDLNGFEIKDTCICPKIELHIEEAKDEGTD